MTVLCKNAFELLARIDDEPGTVIYCDPPYIVKGAKYIHDFTEADHQRLADSLGRFRSARVVVSYYDHPSLEVLYRGWTKRTIEVTKSLVNQGMRMRGRGEQVKAIEALLINGPSLAMSPEPRLFGNDHDEVWSSRREAV